MHYWLQDTSDIASDGMESKSFHSKVFLFFDVIVLPVGTQMSCAFEPAGDNAWNPRSLSKNNLIKWRTNAGTLEYLH